MDNFSEATLRDSDAWPDLRTVLREAYAANLRVTLLFGDPMWTLPANHHYGVELVELAVQFASDIPFRKWI